MQSLVETHLFRDREGANRLVEETKTEKEVLNLAVRLEKDSILFFKSLSGMVKPEKRKIIEDLIAQEELHLSKLAQLRREIEG